MKVLHVIPSVAPRDGGPSHAVVAMCAALRALDVDARIATTDADGPDGLPVPLGTQTAWRGVPAIFFRRNYTVSFKYSRGLASWLDAHVAEFDVVHAHAVLSHAPLAAAAACRATGVPYIVRPLGTVASWSLSRKAWRKQILMRAAGRRALSQAAAIHCTSREESDDLRGQGFPNTTVIPLGVDLPPGDAARGPDSPPYVLSLSRLESKKNLETLIAAFADARRTSATPWRLVIAGDGDPAYAASLREQVRRAGLERDVTFDGWVDGARKERLLAGAALFALPSHHENFGIAVLEAAAQGVPAVVSRGVQLAETLEAADAAWIAGTDRASFAGALGAAMADDEARVRRSVRARALARDYSWGTVAERLRALYASVMRR